MPKLFVIRLLGLFLLCVPAASTLSGDPDVIDCAGVRLEVQVKKADPGLENGTAEALVEGAEKPVYYIFYKASGALLSKNVNSSKVENIKPGTYYCSIVDGKGCTKKTEFKIE